MIEGDLSNRFNSLPPAVRSYLEVNDQVASSDDPQEHVKLDLVRFTLIDTITADPEKTKALGEFLKAKNDALPKVATVFDAKNHIDRNGIK